MIIWLFFPSFFYFRTSPRLTRSAALYTILRVYRSLELLEALLGADALRDLQHVEAHGLGQRTALADGGDVSHSDVTARNGIQIISYVALDHRNPNASRRLRFQL